MTHAEGIPLKIGGVQVGTARIHQGGTIELMMGPSPLGQEILEMIQADLVDGLSIRPTMKPAKPVRPIKVNNSRIRSALFGYPSRTSDPGA